MINIKKFTDKPLNQKENSEKIKPLEKIEKDWFYKNYLTIGENTFGSFWSQEPFALQPSPYKVEGVDYYHVTEEGLKRVFPEYQSSIIIKNVSYLNAESFINYAKKYNMISYYINKNNFRCDNLKTNHDKKHILFSGCSVSFGVGVDYEKTWCKKVYNKLNQYNEYDGYFNISIPGASIIEIIGNIFQYVKKYNNPETIFILLPNASRDTRYSNEEILYHEDNTSVDNDKAYSKLVFYYYLALEQYCISNNIKLISSSWHHNSFNDNFVTNQGENFEKSFLNIFETYKFIKDIDKFYNDIELYLFNNNCLFLGDDDKHPGEPMHDAWYKFMIEEFYK